MKKMSMWTMAAWFFGLLAAGETIRMIYLWATGGKISPIACLMEILLLLLISFFCSNKNRKKQEEARLSGPLVTEERQKQAKKGQKEPIVICPEGKPYLIAAIGFYVVFLVSAIAMLVWFSWPKVLLSGTLGGICLYDLYKYMRIKTDIAAAKDREAFLQRKKQARREALKRRLIWCEGTFSAQKRSHNLRQIFRRGLEAAEDHGLLSAAALNLKRLIKCLG